LPIINEKFNQKFKNHNLEEMKKLDFIFWSSGKIKKKKENQNGENGFHTIKELDEIDNK